MFNQEHRAEAGGRREPADPEGAGADLVGIDSGGVGLHSMICFVFL